METVPSTWGQFFIFYSLTVQHLLKIVSNSHNTNMISFIVMGS